MAKPSQFQVFFDGDCPLCKREIDWLKKRDREHQIEFIDIAGPLFDASIYGKTYDELMAEIHGRTSDGQWVIGVEVFRHLYQAAGFNLPVRLSRLPIVRTGLDLGYRVFARYRTRITGRCKTGACHVDSKQIQNSSHDINSERLAKETTT